MTDQTQAQIFKDTQDLYRALSGISALSASLSQKLNEMAQANRIHIISEKIAERDIRQPTARALFPKPIKK